MIKALDPHALQALVLERAPETAKVRRGHSGPESTTTEIARNLPARHK
jgi:hypothetical protein